MLRNFEIASATGQHSFAHEQSQLIADSSSQCVIFVQYMGRDWSDMFCSLQGGSSRVDILICTPGRLIDHINGTPNFSLQHLRFLVCHFLWSP